jgi:hypothetical protein
MTIFTCFTATIAGKDYLLVFYYVKCYNTSNSTPGAFTTIFNKEGTRWQILKR